MNLNMAKLETNFFNNRMKLFDWFDDELLLQHPNEVKNKIRELIKTKGMFSVGIGTK
ncbi:hypothetical protein LCGC14_0603380 [marine sediment metagenome]|uniref:Uncharacterized protein n=1 Tax=marine sediment metagenome TaxID=412755 RepID=A0A0F9UIH6_9ZZZZ